MAASAFPIAFLNNPATYVLLVFALFLEWTGLCSGAWVLARVMKKVTGIQYDEVYVGTPEDRIAGSLADKEFTIEQEVGHLFAKQASMKSFVVYGIDNKGGMRGSLVGSKAAISKRYLIT